MWLYQINYLFELFFYLFSTHFNCAKTWFHIKFWVAKKKRSKYIYSKFNKTLIFIKQIRLIELWQNVLKKKIKDIWHRNQSLPICVYTLKFMLILNFHLIEINTGNICYNRVYFGKISSNLYISLCLLLALILQKTLLALHC